MFRLPRPLQRDVLIAAAFGVAVVSELAFSNRSSGPFVVDAPLYGMAAMALVWRRTLPVAAAMTCAAFVVLGTGLGTDVDDMATSILVLVLPTYALGHEVEGRRAFLALAASMVAVVTVTILSGAVNPQNVGFPLGAQLAAFTIGRLLRTRTLLTRTLADEAARLELDRALRAQAAVGEERARIAREMHDVVAHTMAIMVVQAGAARRVLDRDPAAAEQALGTVEETGRVALGELRRLLGFLREDAPAALEPQPTLDGLAALIQGARDAGLPVELRIEGEPGALPAGAELAAYRVVQEALTNSLKHAGEGARATVLLRWTVSALELSVADTGGAGSDLGGNGHGLLGMRERVTMTGGTLTAGPRPGGGFAVDATIPRTEVPA
jgi:signal transduction histidine kinase